ncbi:MAG: pseudaminic acid cytidylyltransferase [Marinifilaceae bacterium]|jgi:N-acylneuraminate cytidylyltransferase|nr:pseudaminic acid cytidylyltransferase [Marinifilaceae bacterium]
MKNIAIIPARGGSKRIPRKNIKEFCGKPIIAYSIEAALKSGLFDEVMVSTDDKEIAEIAIHYGAKVPFLRSSKNSDDYATTYDVLEEVIKCYESNNEEINLCCCIYPTAPFINEEKLINAHSLLMKHNFDSIFPVIRFGYPVQRGLVVDDKLKIKMKHPEYLNSRSQDLQPVFHDAGQFYFFKSKNVKSYRSLWTDNSGYVEVKEIEGQDIDNETDWKLAELKFQLLNE